MHFRFAKISFRFALREHFVLRIIHLVYWEDIKENDILKGYVETTLNYNEDKKSQILNNKR